MRERNGVSAHSLKEMKVIDHLREGANVNGSSKDLPELRVELTLRSHFVEPMVGPTEDEEVVIGTFVVNAPGDRTSDTQVADAKIPRDEGHISRSCL